MISTTGALSQSYRLWSVDHAQCCNHETWRLRPTVPSAYLPHAFHISEAAHVRSADARARISDYSLPINKRTKVTVLRTCFVRWDASEKPRTALFKLISVSHRRTERDQKAARARPERGQLRCLQLTKVGLQVLHTAWKEPLFLCMKLKSNSTAGAVRVEANLLGTSTASEILFYKKCITRKYLTLTSMSRSTTFTIVPFDGKYQPL